MDEPDLDERREYWKWAHAISCFKAVEGTLKRLREFSIPDESITRIILNGVITTYAKPFTNCHGVGKLDSTIVPQEYFKTHEALIDFRHKTIAHYDAVNFEPDDPTFGNLNRVVISKSPSGIYGYRTMHLSPDILTSLPVEELCWKLIKKVDYRMTKFENRFIKGVQFRSGNYLLNVDPSEKRAFLRQKDRGKNQS